MYYRCIRGKRWVDLLGLQMQRTGEMSHVDADTRWDFDESTFVDSQNHDDGVLESAAILKGFRSATYPDDFK